MGGIKVEWSIGKIRDVPENEISSEGCLHCEINELVGDHIEGQQNVDIADLAGQMAESLVELLLIAPEEEHGNLLAATITHLGHAFLVKSGVLAAAICQHAQQLDLLTLKEWQNAIVEEIGSRERRLAIIELGAGDFGVGVDEGLLINAPDALEIADIEGVLGPAIAGMAVAVHHRGRAIRSPWVMGFEASHGQADRGYLPRA